jgi:hypothetical protein
VLAAAIDLHGSAQDPLLLLWLLVGERTHALQRDLAIGCVKEEPAHEARGLRGPLAYDAGEESELHVTGGGFRNPATGDSGKTALTVVTDAQAGLAAQLHRAG